MTFMYKALYRGYSTYILSFNSHNSTIEILSTKNKLLRAKQLSVNGRRIWIQNSLSLTLTPFPTYIHETLVISRFQYVLIIRHE